LSVTSGHVDIRNRNDPHPNMSNRGSFNWMDVGVNSLSYIVDGDTEIRRAVRENFRRGATQIKYTGTGGVTSPSDPLHSIQFTPHEIQVMVEATEDWGTYVAAHVFNEEGIIRAIENGVKVLEHIPFLTEKSAKLMIEKNIMFATAVAPVFAVDVETARVMYNPLSFEKWYAVRKAAENMLKVIQNNPEMLKLMTLGTDLVNQWEKTLEQEMKMNLEFKYLAEFFKPIDILRIATSNGARMNELTGKNHPYQEGKLGVVEAGAYADLLLLNSNPLEDITILADPKNNIELIMKDGKIYKNTLE
jgi:imidazolonepropionase-like amidohydrolase